MPNARRVALRHSASYGIPFSIPHSAFVHLKPLAFFFVLAVAWTWPLVTRLSSRIANDPGDPLLNAWILWWNTQAVPFSAGWWSPPIFYPMTGALALSEHLAGIALVTAPVFATGAGALAAYNVALLLSCWLSGYFTFLLVRRLTGSPAAALVAGVAFAIAPYRASQLSHLQVLTAQWMPLALLGMHGYLEDGRRRWLALFAGAWLIQALSNGYYLLFFPILVGAVARVVRPMAHRRAARGHARGHVRGELPRAAAAASRLQGDPRPARPRPLDRRDAPVQRPAHVVRAARRPAAVLADPRVRDPRGGPLPGCDRGGAAAARRRAARS